MADPVLVIHGVANRDPLAFDELVGQLSADLALDVHLVPVFWGDLGARLEGLEDTLPHLGRRAVRGLGNGDAAEIALGLLRAAAPAPTTRSRETLAAVAADGFEGKAESGASAVRAAGARELRSDFESAWLDTQWLKAIANEELVKTLGAAVAEAVGASDEDGTAAAAVRMRPVAAVSQGIKRAVSALDHGVGAVIATIGGELNAYIRGDLAPAFGSFIGDVFTYQRHRDRIHGRVREVLANAAPGWGTHQRPVAILGHSLGGVIAFDLAQVGAPELWVSHLITFGSQSPFFHILDPRGEPLAAFRPGHPVTLGPSIGSWVNLWEPLDPLAFIAAEVFRLASGGPPQDRRVRHLAASKLWTHSSYWRSAELVSAVREELTA